MRNRKKTAAAVLAAAVAACTITACADPKPPTGNLVNKQEQEKKIVNMFSPMGKTAANAENVARTAQEKIGRAHV